MSFIHNHILIRRGGLEPETALTLARMTVKPSIEDAFIYDAFIKEIKTGHALALGANNLSTYFRLLQLSACHDLQVSLLNWATTGFDGIFRSSYNVAGTGLVHTPYKYCSSISATGHIEFATAIFVDSYRTNCTFGLYAYNDPGTIWAVGSAQTNGNTNVLILRSQTVNTNFQCRINTPTILTVTQPLGAAMLYATKRTGNTLTGWTNTTQRGPLTVSDLGAINPVPLGCHGEIRNGDVVGANTGAQFSCHFYGNYSIDLAVMKSAIENYIAKYP